MPEGMVCIRVVNRHHRSTGHAVEYVGRGTPLGNPWAVTREVPRPVALARYADWLRRMVRQRDLGVMAELDRLTARARAAAQRGEALLLECSCAPAPCHADLIRRALYWRMGLAVPIDGADPADPQLALFGR